MFKRCAVDNALVYRMSRVTAASDGLRSRAVAAVLASASMEPNPSLQIMELISGGLAAQSISAAAVANHGLAPP